MNNLKLEELKKFNFEKYFLYKTGIDKRDNNTFKFKSKYSQFNLLCKNILDIFHDEWKKEGKMNAIQVNERHKNAIKGNIQEVKFFEDKISKYLKDSSLMDSWFPSYYPNIVTAIFQENWGYAGLYEWMYSDRYKYSSSAKIIGDKIFLLDPEKGYMKLMPQKIHEQRKSLLIENLYANATYKRHTEKSDTVYTSSGIRVQIFGKRITKKGQSALVFRKYILKDLTLEEQAKYGTIDAECINLIKYMVALGCNIAITGGVRTGKTTILSTLEKLENNHDEGILIESDPEIPMNNIKPNAPIIQLIAESDSEVKDIVKAVLRSDGDRIIVAEARNAIATDLSLKTASKGTKHIKLTYHITNPVDFVFTVADEITKQYSNTNLFSQAINVAKSFNYVFHFIQLKDKRKKRLDSIHEITYNPTTLDITMTPICTYSIQSDSWTWNNFVSKELIDTFSKEDIEKVKLLQRELCKLERDKPMGDYNKINLSYLKGLKEGE